MQFEFVDRKKTWGEDKVFYYDQNKKLTSIPTAWTSLRTADPFIHIAQGRAYFRTEDLLGLLHQIECLQNKGEHDEQN